MQFASGDEDYACQEGGRARARGSRSGKSPVQRREKNPWTLEKGKEKKKFTRKRDDGAKIGTSIRAAAAREKIQGGR